MKRLLAFIALAFVFSLSPAADTKSGGVQIAIKTDVPELMRLLIETANAYLRANPQQDRLRRLRDLFAKLAGQEAQVAAGLVVALQQAQIDRVEGPIVVSVNARLSDARRTFTELTKELSSIRDLGGVEARVVGGLSCVMADSILFGFEGPCPPMTGTRFPPAAGMKGLVFAAGRVDAENAKLRQTIAQIQRESKYLFEIAEAFDKAIGRTR